MDGRWYKATMRSNPTRLAGRRGRAYEDELPGAAATWRSGLGAGAALCNCVRCIKTSNVTGPAAAGGRPMAVAPAVGGPRRAQRCMSWAAPSTALGSWVWGLVALSLQR
jgi:hypothetical protein